MSLRLYGVKCSRCGLGFDKINLVMRARDRVYHVDCFRCVACNRKLIAGDEFALRPIDLGLVCRADYDNVTAGDNAATAMLLPAALSMMTCISGLAADDDVLDDVIDASVAHTSVSVPTVAVMSTGFYGNNNNENETDMKNKSNCELLYLL